MSGNDQSSSDNFASNEFKTGSLLFIDRCPIFLAGAFYAFGVRRYQILGCIHTIWQIDSYREIVRSKDDVTLIAGPQLQIAECFGACHSIRKLNASIKTIFVSEYAKDPIIIADASRVGVNALLPVEIAIDKLCAVIDLVQTNQTLLPQAIGVKADSLTECELRVLKGISQDKSSKQIANELNVSIHTVRNEAQSALSKLQGHTRFDAVRRAQRLGLLADK